MIRHPIRSGMDKKGIDPPDHGSSSDQNNEISNRVRIDPNLYPIQSIVKPNGNPSQTCNMGVAPGDSLVLKREVVMATNEGSDELHNDGKPHYCPSMDFRPTRANQHRATCNTCILPEQISSHRPTRLSQLSVLISQSPS